MPSRDALFRDHYGSIVRLFRKWGYSLEDAEELAQNTFLRVFQRKEQDPPRSPRAYLVTAARSVRANDLRAKSAGKRTATLVPLEPHEQGLEIKHADLPSQTSPNNRVLSRERRELLYEALATLSKNQYEVVVLRLQDWSYEEIAKELGISSNAVKTRLREARRRLRDELGGRDL